MSPSEGTAWKDHESYRSRFQDHLDKVISEGESFIRVNGLDDPETGLPQVDHIEDVLRGYLGVQERLPPREYKMAVSFGPNVGTAYEALGEVEHAIAWYRLGQYVWRGARQFKSADTDPTDFARRMTAGMYPMEAAICADRIGESHRTRDLFSWAAANRTITEQERIEFANNGQYSVVWEWILEKGYALLCLDRWSDALDACEDAIQWLTKDGLDRAKQSEQMPLMILPLIIALAK
jgi:hypothetical protein